MPLTATTTIELEQMMAGSGLKSTGDGNLQQDFTTTEDANVTSGNLGRRNVWDDEEEEEEVR